MRGVVFLIYRKTHFILLSERFAATLVSIIKALMIYYFRDIELFLYPGHEVLFDSISILI